MTQPSDLDTLHFTIPALASKYSEFRRVLWTGKHQQLVLMTIQPGEEIGEEVHETNDQLLSFIRGTGEGIVGDEKHRLDPGDVCAVPAGTRHNFINTGDEPLVLYTIYSPPEHPGGTVFASKAEADAAEESGHDAPPSA